ncbi:MAG: DUF3243 domain-containing protein [Firmicutes bacterium]|nr:DUF3243 domain-containing protein [Bacillota bacterium]
MNLLEISEKRLSDTACRIGEFFGKKIHPGNREQRLLN